MSETRVVNVKCDEYDVYIGRASNRYDLPESRWANPFRIGRDGTRTEVIEKYRVYLLSNSDLVTDLITLAGKRLGCWCATAGGITADDDLICHGQVLAELADHGMEVRGTNMP